MPVSHDIVILALQVVIMVLQAILGYVNAHQTTVLKDLQNRANQESEKQL
jgi:hypothetical protein